jgi:hypothetical protein
LSLRLVLLVPPLLLAGLVGHAGLVPINSAVDAGTQPVATIASDLADYPPGRTVT